MSSSDRRRPMAAPPLLILLLSLIPSASPDLAADLAALLLLRSAIGPTSPALAAWSPTTSPCSWPGVACESNRVTELHLPGAGLSGHIPLGVLGNLTSLRLLSLRLNALSGPLPADLATCSELRHLYLQGNALSGPIPASLSSLPNLVRLNLAGNRFTGPIPAGLNNLTRLATLYLESNLLSGELPSIDIPTLALFNVSFNPINGAIPTKLQSMPAAAFLGTSLCGAPRGPCPAAPEPQAPPVRNKRKLSAGAIAAISISTAVIFLFLMILLVLSCQRMHRQSDPEAAAKQLEAEMALTERRRSSADRPPPLASHKKGLVFFERRPAGYDLDDLLKASAEVLGQGTAGTMYKAVFDNGIVVAVKRLKGSGVSEAEFRERMEAVGAMRHRNLVSLQAYFYSQDDKLLVFDYMSRGNRGPSRAPITWELRATIALAVARGIAYIHSRDPRATHGSIKSSNVLLSGSYDDIRVSDHGLSGLVASTSPRSRVLGYCAPEVTDSRKISQKADVYSFGVLLLELLTGKAPCQTIHDGEGIDLPRWVKSVVQEEWTAEVFDMELMRYPDVEEEMVSLLRVAVDCVEMHPDRRPAMLEVVARVDEIHQSSLGSAERVGKARDDRDDADSPLTRYPQSHNGA